jgi:hypothetical protein
VLVDWTLPQSDQMSQVAWCPLLRSILTYQTFADTSSVRLNHWWHPATVQQWRRLRDKRSAGHFAGIVNFHTLLPTLVKVNP